MLLVLPGGGYNLLAAHEGTPVARAFAPLGIHTAVLHYRVQYHASPAPLGRGPLLDGLRAIQLLRHHAGAWRIAPDKIAVLGFSAGGHLAGCLAVHGRTMPETVVDDVIALNPAHPNAALLAYAVLSADPLVQHAGSLNQLCGEDRAGCGFFDLPKHVASAGPHPPTFLWHTANDPVVSVENALIYARALQAQAVPFALHVFPSGRHGLGLALGTPCAIWVDLARQWLCQTLGHKPPPAVLPAD